MSRCTRACVRSFIHPFICSLACSTTMSYRVPDTDRHGGYSLCPRRVNKLNDLSCVMEVTEEGQHCLGKALIGPRMFVE